MPFAITLRFDTETESVIEDMRQSLAAAAIVHGQQLDYGAHITLAIYPDDSPVDALKGAGKCGQALACIAHYARRVWHLSRSLSHPLGSPGRHADSARLARCNSRRLAGVNAPPTLPPPNLRPATSKRAIAQSYPYGEGRLVSEELGVRECVYG